MNLRRTAIIAGAIVTSTSATGWAQEEQAASPQWRIGTLEVAQHTEAPFQLSRSVVIDATPHQVYDLISDPENWIDLVGPARSVSVSGTGGPGSLRTFTMEGGAEISDRVVATTAPTGSTPGVYAWSAPTDNAYGLRDHLAAIEFAPADAGRAFVSFYVIYDHDAPDRVAQSFGATMDAMLANLVYKFGGERAGSVQGIDTVHIRQHRLVEASADRAWEVLGERWGDIDEWSSVVAHSEFMPVRGKPDVGAQRTCEIPGTPGFKETVLRYDVRNRTVSYVANEGMPPFVERAENTWSVVPLGPNRSRIEMHFTGQIRPNTPAAAVGMLKQQFTPLIDMTTVELVHYIETGKRHPRTVAADRRRP